MSQLRGKRLFMFYYINSKRGADYLTVEYKLELNSERNMYVGKVELDIRCVGRMVIRSVISMYRQLLYRDRY